MDAVRLDEGRWELDEVVGRAEAGETVDIVRENRVVARVVPATPDGIRPPERTMTQDEWRAFLAELAAFRASLRYDPSNSVEEMRREARY